jgi:hypothetical protein
MPNQGGALKGWQHIEAEWGAGFTKREILAVMEVHRDRFGASAGQRQTAGGSSTSFVGLQTREKKSAKR